MVIKMRIAMMTNSYKPFTAGVPISIERLSKGLRENGHKVVIFAPGYRNQQEEEDVIRYRTLIKGVANGFSVPDILDAKIEKAFQAGKFDIIHVHHPMLIGRVAVYLSHKYHVPLVYTYHTRYEQYLHYIKAPFLKNKIPDYINRYAENCELVFAPTPSMQAYLEKNAVNSRIAVLPTGLTEESFEANDAAAAGLRRKLLGDKKYLFCTVARLAKEKNMDFLFRVLAARKRKEGSDFRLVAVGEGAYEKQLIKLAQELDIQEEVIFAGKAPNEEIKNYCRASDVFCFASLSETQGIVLLEAMAAGLPVLALKASGVCDVVVNGGNGYMTDVSEEEYGKKLQDLVSQDRTHLERGALETAKKYEIREIAKRAALYYNIAIQDHKRNAPALLGKHSDMAGRTGGAAAWKHFIF